MPKYVDNCVDCGRFVSAKTAGDHESEISDLDGQLCITSMWCKSCAKNRPNPIPVDTKRYEFQV